MRLLPFSLKETEMYLTEKEFNLGRYRTGMILLDFITRQDDRHLSNMAIKINNEGESFYPLYDNGRSLFYEDTEEMVKQSICSASSYNYCCGQSCNLLLYLFCDRASCPTNPCEGTTLARGVSHHKGGTQNTEICPFKFRINFFYAFSIALSRFSKFNCNFTYLS